MRVFTILLFSLLLIFQSCESSTNLTIQELEKKDLNNLFLEIETLAKSDVCLDANNWSFIAYGSKACGEPQGFIAYSKEINTVIFFQKVKDYTEAERLYNLKWNVVSDCSIINSPISVECINGFPKLNY